MQQVTACSGEKTTLELRKIYPERIGCFNSIMLSGIRLCFPLWVAQMSLSSAFHELPLLFVSDIQLDLSWFFTITSLNICLLALQIFAIIQCDTFFPINKLGDRQSNTLDFMYRYVTREKTSVSCGAECTKCFEKFMHDFVSLCQFVQTPDEYFRRKLEEAKLCQCAVKSGSALF